MTDVLRTTLTAAWARKGRLASTSFSVVIGVAFLFATLVLGDTMRSSFSAVFRQANAGADVIVRNAETIGTDDDEVRGHLDRSLVDEVLAVPGVTAVVPQTIGNAQILGTDGSPIGGDGPPTMARDWTDDPVNPFHLAEGRAPERAGEVVIDARSAEIGDLAVGDETTVLVPEPLPVTVVGIARFGDLSSMSGATFVGFTQTQAIELLGAPDEVDELLVRGDGISEDDLLAAIEPVLPAKAEAMTAAELSAEQQAAVESDFLGFVRLFLLAFAGIALVVASFSIYNTFTILIAQRSRESALLRAIGASRGQVLSSVVIEALVIGLAASVIGIGAGYGLGLGLKALLDMFGLELATAGLTVGPTAVAASFTVGVAVTVLASLLPALRASRVAPIEALRDAAAESAAISTARIAIGAVAAIAGIGLTVLGPTTNSAFALVGLGSLLVLAGAVVLGPIVARPAASAIGAPIEQVRGQAGRLARLNAMRNPRRTASSALALVIGTAVVALFATFGSSLQASIDQTVDQSFGGDLVLVQGGFSGAAISPFVGNEVAELPEVDVAVAVANGVARSTDTGGGDLLPAATDPARLAALLDMDVEAGSLGDLAPGQVAVGRSFADARRLDIGDELGIEYIDGTEQQLEVGAIYGVEGLLGELIMTTEDWAPHADRPGDVVVLIGLAKGVSLDEGRAAVQAVSDRYAGPEVQDRDEYIDSVAGEVDQLLILVYGLLGLAVLIALLGIANTLSLSIHERTRELGLLRAVGLTRSALRATVRWESVITAVVGTTVGLTVGTFLGWGMVQALATEDGFIIFELPLGTLVVVLGLAVAAGVTAAIRPARRAARLDVLAAIAGR